MESGNLSFMPDSFSWIKRQRELRAHGWQCAGNELQMFRETDNTRPPLGTEQNIGVILDNGGWGLFKRNSECLPHTWKQRHQSGSSIYCRNRVLLKSMLKGCCNNRLIDQYININNVTRRLYVPTLARVPLSCSGKKK